MAERDDVIRFSEVPLSARLKELAAKTYPEGMTNLELHLMGLEAAKLEQSLADARGNNTDLCRLLDAEREKR